MVRDAFSPVLYLFISSVTNKTIYLVWRGKNFISFLMPTRVHPSIHLLDLYLGTTCIQSIPAHSFTLLYIYGVILWSLMLPYGIFKPWVQALAEQIRLAQDHWLVEYNSFHKTPNTQDQIYKTEKNHRQIKYSWRVCKFILWQQGIDQNRMAIAGQKSRKKKKKTNRIISKVDV